MDSGTSQQYPVIGAPQTGKSLASCRQKRLDLGNYWT